MRKEILIKVLVVVAGLFLLSTPNVFAGHFCKADCDGDCKVNLSDLVQMKTEFIDPECEACSPPVPAPVQKTGRTVSFRTGDDGDLEKGVSWPNPRFTDNGNGTVTDNFTGLIWMKNANCFGVRSWSSALSDCNTLHAPHPYCGLDDGSNAGNWRLPNRFELESLLDLDYRCITSMPPTTTTTIYPPSHVPIPNTAGDGPWSEGDPFTNVQPYWYWSSTSYAEESDHVSIWAWEVEFSRGQVIYTSSGVSNYVWCVRGEVSESPPTSTTTSSILPTCDTSGTACASATDCGGPTCCCCSGVNLCSSESICINFMQGVCN